MKVRLSSQQGFSLLEILIAFSILALSLGVLLNIFSGGLRRASISEEYQQAVTIAQSVLAKVGVEEALQIGLTQGIVHEKYQWTQDIYSLSEDGMDEDSVNFFPFRVIVRVEWEAGENSRQVELVTLRLSGEQSEM